MLKLNSKGLLAPNTNILSSLADLKHCFVDAIPSATRQENFKKYIYYSDELKKALNIDSLKQWVNGSFVTRVKNPKDIDVVSFIDFELRMKYENELKSFEAKGANEIYGVDAYILTVFRKAMQNFSYSRVTVLIGWRNSAGQGVTTGE